jgi:hypothetical protein
MANLNSTKHFILVIDGDVPYTIEVRSSIKEVKKALLKAGDPDNIWYEYNVLSGKLCILSGRGMYDQCTDIFKALKKFDHTFIEETTCVQGYEIDDDYDDDLDSIERCLIKMEVYIKKWSEGLSDEELKPYYPDIYDSKVGSIVESFGYDISTKDPNSILGLFCKVGEMIANGNKLKDVLVVYNKLIQTYLIIQKNQYL